MTIVTDWISHPTAVPFSQDAMNDPYGTDAKALSAGRELDAVIAEKVMGWGDVREHQVFEQTGDAQSFTLEGARWLGRPDWNRDALFDVYDEVPSYSSDIKAAWTVVERMRKLGWALEYQGIAGHDATFSERIGARRRVHADDCESAPLAICRAALAATAP